jgi:acyl homoserine lactone synthase
VIKIIPGELRGRYPRLFDEMHKLRRSVFYERLKWQVTVINRWEIDGYDALDPLYVLCLDENERVTGGLRLLPTVGFNMLNDSFPQLLPDGGRIQSPLIWESSRFTVRMTGQATIDSPAISRAAGELGLALNEIGKAAALTHIVCVYDCAVHRMLSRIGCAGEPLGSPQIIGGVEICAALYEVGSEWGAHVRRLAGDCAMSVDSEVVEGLRAWRGRGYSSAIGRERL